MSTVYYLPIKKAAEAFGVSYSQIYKAVTDGDLVAIQNGTRWLVKPADVDSWLVANSRTNQIADGG